MAKITNIYANDWFIGDGDLDLYTRFDGDTGDLYTFIIYETANTTRGMIYIKQSKFD